jgi:phage tail-like protein
MSYYPPVAFHFKVEIGLDDLHENDVRFQEVSGLSRELGVEQVAEGGENRFEHRLPVRGKFVNLVLKRGLLTESGVISWIRHAIENFEFKSADVLVSLMDEEHMNPAPGP